METITRKIKEFERAQAKTNDKAEKTPLSIAETFVSIQGEGFYTGTRMLFIRTAGCNVGGPCTAGASPICTLYDGRKFDCDTDYNKTDSMNLEEIKLLIGRSQVDHVCFTGGEPLLHARTLEKLVMEILLEENNNYKQATGHSSPPERILTKFHIETSGTRRIPVDLEDNCWIACAPKRGYNPKVLMNADEIKLLVDQEFDIQTAYNMIAGTKAEREGHVYLQPVNNVMSVDNDNIQKCLKLLQQQPSWKLSVQLHKYLEVR